MDNVQTLKQIVQTNKMAFEYNYTMMMNVYEQNKLMLHTFLNQSADTVPAELKGALEEWLLAYRKGCDELKTMTDDSFHLVEESLSSFQES